MRNADSDAQDRRDMLALLRTQANLNEEQFTALPKDSQQRIEGAWIHHSFIQELPDGDYHTTRAALVLIVNQERGRYRDSLLGKKRNNQ